MAAQVARVAITPKSSRYFTRAMVVAVAVFQTIYTKYGETLILFNYISLNAHPYRNK